MDNIFQYYKDCLKFEGRLGRLEYLKRNLALIGLLVFVAIFVMLLSSVNKSIDESISITIFFIAFFGIFIVLGIFSTVAGVMLNIRRIHDINLSGWWVLFLTLLGIIVSPLGLIILLFYFVFPGTVGENNFGRKEEVITKTQNKYEEYEVEEDIEEPKKITKKTYTKKKSAPKKAAKKTTKGTK